MAAVQEQLDKKTELILSTVLFVPDFAVANRSIETFTAL
jgi:hypothetical protein